MPQSFLQLESSDPSLVAQDDKLEVFSTSINILKPVILREPTKISSCDAATATEESYTSVFLQLESSDPSLVAQDDKPEVFSTSINILKPVIQREPPNISSCDAVSATEESSASDFLQLESSDPSLVAQDDMLEVFSTSINILKAVILSAIVPQMFFSLSLFLLLSI